MLSVINIYRELGISYFKTENNIDGMLLWEKTFLNFILKMEHDYVGKDIHFSQ